MALRARNRFDKAKKLAAKLKVEQTTAKAAEAFENWRGGRT